MLKMKLYVETIVQLSFLDINLLQNIQQDTLYQATPKVRLSKNNKQEP